MSPPTPNFGPGGRGSPLDGSGSSQTSAEEVERILAGCDAAGGMHLDLDLEVEGLIADAQIPAKIDIRGIFDEVNSAMGEEIGVDAASDNGLLDGDNGSGNSNSNKTDVPGNSDGSSQLGNSFGAAQGNFVHSYQGSSMLDNSFHSVPEFQPSVNRAQDTMLRKSFSGFTSRVSQLDCINGVKRKSAELNGDANFGPAPTAAMDQNRHDRRPRRRATMAVNAVPTSPSRPQSRAAPRGWRADSDLVNHVSIHSMESDASNARPRPWLQATEDSSKAPTTLCGLCRPEALATSQARAGLGPQGQIDFNVSDDSKLSMSSPGNPRPQPRQLQRPQRRVVLDLTEVPNLNERLGGDGSGVNNQARTLCQTPAKGNVNGTQYREELQKHNMQYLEELQKLTETTRQTELLHRQLKMLEGRLATQDGSVFNSTSSPGPHSPQSPQPQAFASSNAGQRKLEQRVATSGLADGATARTVGAGADEASPFQQSGRTPLSRRQLTMQDRRVFGTLGPHSNPLPFGAKPLHQHRPLAFTPLDSARRKLQQRVAASGFAEMPSARGQGNL